MTDHYVQHVPTRVLFGSGRFGQLGEAVASLGNSALIVCGRSAMRQLGVLDRALQSLRSAGVRVEVFDDVSADPLVGEVEEGTRVAQRSRSAVVVGLGGGSALDAAKAVGVCAEASDPSALFGQTLELRVPRRPVVAIPTTCGSGAEVTKGAIITDEERGHKTAIRGPAVFPTVAIVDPSLAALAPRSLVAETAFDALTHVIEGRVARSASPVTDALTAGALQLLARWLPEIDDRPLPTEGQAALSNAAVLGGMSVATASTCLPHRLQQALPSKPKGRGLSHARGLASIYPAWIRSATPHRSERFTEIAALFSVASASEAINGIRHHLGVDESLADAGYDDGDIERAVRSVTGNIGNDPIPSVTETMIRSLYNHAMGKR